MWITRRITPRAWLIPAAARGELWREASAEDLAGEVAAAVMAEGALGHDPRVGERPDGGGDVLPAPLAADREIANPRRLRTKHVCQYRRI